MDCTYLNINTPPRSLININIYLYIYNLLKYIFFKVDESKNNENNLNKKRLEKILLFVKISNEKINQRIAKSSNNEKPKEITIEYSKENFENIISFLKQQNQIYIGDILGNILTQICGLAMKIDPYETINENIFNSLKSIPSKGEQEEKDLDRVRNFINVEIFKDKKMKKNLYPPFNEIVVCPFIYLLFYSYKSNLDIINNHKKFNNYNTMKYIFNYYIDCAKNYFMDNIGKKVNDYLSKEFEIKKLSSFFNIHYFSHDLEKEFDNISKLLDEEENKNIIPNSSIDIIRYFFYTLFVYYKTINDNLLKDSKLNINEKNKTVNIPFTYDIECGFMNVVYALMIISPIKTIKNIKHVSFRQNNLADIGIFEIGKALLFNKEIETLNYDKNLTRAYYFSYFIFNQRIFENYNVKKISIYNNIYIREDIDILLCEIIKHFKGLKVINISNNELKSGIKNFCIELKKLYRENKCEIEELNFNKCVLNDESVYELSELLKCKQCKLKSLNLNKNNIKDAPKIFTCIKKNKSLVKLYVNKCLINNDMIKKINKIISLHVNLESIDISKNRIKSSDQLIRLIYRTKIIKRQWLKNDDVISIAKEKIINNHKHLLFLDISQNPVDYLQNKFIDYIKDISLLSNLKILDCTKIIFGEYPNLFIKKKKTPPQTDFYEYVKSNLSNSGETIIIQ